MEPDHIFRTRWSSGPNHSGYMCGCTCGWDATRLVYGTADAAKAAWWVDHWDVINAHPRHLSRVAEELRREREEREETARKVAAIKTRFGKKKVDAP